MFIKKYYCCSEVGMIEIICLIFPSLFSVFALERLLGKSLCVRNFLFVFVTNTLIINIVSLFSIYVLSGAATMPLSTVNGIKLSYSSAFLVISSIVTCLLVLVERFYFYRLRIHVSDQKKNDNIQKTLDNEKR
jgi:Ni/Fe-hydrogenase subunit HybB-like protein